MKNFIQHGHTLAYTVPSSTTLTVGQPILLGALLYVVLSTNNNTATATTGEVVTLQAGGVFELDKKTGAGTAASVGAKVYWVAADSKVSGVASGNTHIGYAWNTTVDGDTTQYVKLLIS